MKASIAKVWVDDISFYPHNPIWAIFTEVDGREMVLDSKNSLFDDKNRAERFAEKVQNVGEIETNRWTYTSMNDYEREAHYEAMYEWEEIEKMAGRW